MGMDLIAPAYPALTPVPQSAQIRGVDLTQTGVYDLDFKGPLLLTGIFVVGRLITSLSAGATLKVEEYDRDAYTAAVQATLSTTLTGANNDLTFTAVDGGTGGNSTTIAFVDPGTPSAALSVSVNPATQAITVNLATSVGTAQVETATAAGTISGSGNASVTVTGAGITGSPKTISVAVVNGDTAATWAGKVRTALAADAAVTALYTVGGSSTTITLTRTVAAANDATLNIALANGTCTGITTAATSANTTAGVAPAITSTAAQVLAAIQASAAASSLVTVANKAANDGTGTVTALTATALTGGAAAIVGGVRQTLVASGTLSSSDATGKVQQLSLASGYLLTKQNSIIRLTVSGGATASAALSDVVVNGIAVA